jgi:hypothetical protein
MKQIPILLLLGLALSLCNLTSKLKNVGSSNSNSNSGSGPSSSSDITAEKAQPTAAQTAALAGGEEIKWIKQGMSWTMPPKWTKTTDDRNSFALRSPGSWDAANMIVSISAMADDFPVDVSIKAYYDGAKTRMKNGELDQLRWLEIDGVKGIQFREAAPDQPDGIRRMQWIAYRKYAGQVQQVNIILSTDGKDYPRHEDVMNGVLYSTKLDH